jgi:FkbM family methyltransferase
MGLKTIVVEPLTDNIKCIEEAARLNSLEDKIKIYHKAIGSNDTDSIEIFLGDQTNENGKAHEFIGSAFGFSSGSQKETVKTISLDTIFTENNISKCSILKIDCEGGEWDCFKGASVETLDKIQYIVGELHFCGPYTNSNSTEFLKLFQQRFKDVSASMGLSIGSSGLASFILEHI